MFAMREAKVSGPIRELADKAGVSERTMWRRYATMRSTGTLPEPRRTCEWCGYPLPERVTLRRRFCDDYCRVTAHRAQPRADRPLVRA